MPELNHRFQAGRMNKDLDERLVPNGEYRDALNVQVATSDGSDVGSLQTIMGNLDISSQIIGKRGGPMDFYCVGSIVDEKTDKIYWLMSGVGHDIIAEYNYKTEQVEPVLVDIFNPSLYPASDSGRVLNFDKSFLITGINIIDDYLFWTDNNTEPKSINITRSKLGCIDTAGDPDWYTKSTLYIKNPDLANPNPPYIPSGEIKHADITVIKKSPQIAPKLEMKGTTRADLSGDNVINITSTVSFTDPVATFWDNTADPPWWTQSQISITLDTAPDFKAGDIIELTPNGAGLSITQSASSILLQIESNIDFTSLPGQAVFNASIISGNVSLSENTDTFDVELRRDESLFKFKFPRFAYRYKYQDGQYSTFSPFSEVAFLPSKFDYITKEGYNLGMVNNIRYLAVKDFVDTKLIPDDVVSIDILYKESNSPVIYSVETIKRQNYQVGKYDRWNGINHTTTSEPPYDFVNTTGYLNITSEIIHAALPANQLLRSWDNVPRKALAQEIVGNRLVYGNYLQNYNMFSSRPTIASAFLQYPDKKYLSKSDNITVDIKIAYTSQKVGDDEPEEFDPSKTNTYSPSKSIKTLRTYQLGVVYIDEFGRETPVFSASKNSRNSIKIAKKQANLAGKLKAQAFNIKPEWATGFKFLVKESSNEYYNLAMDRWYDAEDGNIWLSFPSSERNKVDEETFLILKKQHDNNVFVSDTARYKILAIENEAPLFIKTKRVPQGIVEDGTGISTTNPYIIGSGPTSEVGIPQPNVSFMDIEIDASDFILNRIIEDSALNWELRIVANNGVSRWYEIRSVVDKLNGYYRVTVNKLFGVDMEITSPISWIADPTAALANVDRTSTVEFVKKSVINSPEYDGRFFVKILKDSSIQENIIGPEAGISTNWIVNHSIQSQYINPQAPDFTQSSLGEEFFGYATTNSATSGLISISNKHSGTNSKHAVHINDFGEGQNYWDEAGNTPNINSKSSGWFIDKVEGFRNFKYTKNFYSGKNDPWFNTNESAGSFFKTMFWNYESPQPRKQAQLIGTNTYTNSAADDYLGQNQLKNPGNTLRNDTSTFGEIVPSVGIQDLGDGSALFHLSHTGTNDGSPGKANKDFSSLSDLRTGFGHSDWASLYVDEEAFAVAITTPGTIWRWKEDPDQIVYKTLAGPNGTGQSSTEWSKNTTDANDGELGVSLFNYTKFEDYGVRHKVVYRGGNVNPLGWNLVYVADIVTTGFVSQGISDHSKDYNFFGGAAIALVDYGIDVINPLWYLAHYNNDLGDYDTAGGWGGFNVPGIGTLGGSDPHYRYPMYTEDWDQAKNRRRRFQFRAIPFQYKDGDTIDLNDPNIGPQGPGNIAGTGNYLPTNDPDLAPHFSDNGTVLTSTSAPYNNTSNSDPVRPTTTAPGIRPDGMYSGRIVSGGTIPSLKTETSSSSTPPNTVSGAPGTVTWEIVEKYFETGTEDDYSSTNPAIWETEPKEDLDLELYHEVGQIYPTKLDDSTMEQFLGPIRSSQIENTKVECWNPPGIGSGGWVDLNTGMGTGSADEDIRINSHGSVDTGDERFIYLEDINYMPLQEDPANASVAAPTVGSRLIFTKADGSRTECTVKSIQAGSNGYELYEDVHNYEVTLPWFNCYSFGNGVESNRIRDDYNQVFIDKGPRVSTIIQEPYMEDRRSTGLIYSGIYNSKSNINNLNQFIQAEKITKDLNPDGGSIQKLYTRDTNLVTFCEDKIFKILANKDALYNADGNPQLISTDRVLGQATTFVGDFGISTNPESFATESFRMYFTDRTRGAVLRLSQDGLTPISNVGMKDWFDDNLVFSNRLVGTFDEKKKEYNLSLSYYDYNSHSVGIKGASKSGSAPYVPTNILVVDSNVAKKLNLGDDVVGPGIPLNSFISSKIYMGGGEWQITITQMPTAADVAPLGDPIPYGVATPTSTPEVMWPTRVTSSSEQKPSNTLSFSEPNKGWVSFKSFKYEDGVSLNNEYYTFKYGQLFKHHAIDTQNEFYGDQYDSSVEVIFNQAPGSVKSFNTLSYEGSQSHITEDIDNSGEYWDNKDKLGWYVNNIYTDLQEGDLHEFKDKEGKWFSQIKGVATEWLDDGTAGNIDTNELSYQGIDQADEVTIITGDFTSWDCVPGNVSSNCSGLNYPNGVDWTADIAAMTCSSASPGGTICCSPVYATAFESANYNTPISELGYWTAPMTAAQANFTNYYCVNDNGDVIYQMQTLGFGGVTTAQQLVDYLNSNNWNIPVGASWADVVQLQSTLSGYPFMHAACGATSGWPLFGAGGGIVGYGNPTSMSAACIGCNGGTPSDYSCVEVQGISTQIDPTSLGGPFINENQCLTEPDGLCNNACWYKDWAEVFSVEAIDIDCLLGQVRVEVTMDSSATDWIVYYRDPSWVLPTVVDPTTYTFSGTSNWITLPAGDWEAVIKDSNNCKEEILFNVNCNPGGGPGCATTNPHVMNISVNDTTSTIANNCDPTNVDGSIGVQMTTLGNTATTWNIEYFSVIAGVSTLIHSDGPFWNNSISTLTNLDTGDYEIAITDDLNCRYLEPINIGCNVITPTWDCTGPGGAWSYTQNNFMPAGYCYDPIAEGYGTYGPYTDATAISNGFTTALDECLDGCVGCPTNVSDTDPGPFQITPTIGNTTGITDATINLNGWCGTPNTQNAGGNGSVTVTMDNMNNYGSTLPLSWSIEYYFEDNFGNPPVLIYSDTTAYALPTAGNPVSAAPIGNLSSNSAGTYTYYITAWHGMATYQSCVFGPYPMQVLCTGVLGCTNPSATNYDPLATVDDGSCIIPGCTEPTAVNYNPAATVDDGSCIILGCMDPLATNYNPIATANDPNDPCVYPTSALRYDCSGLGVDWGGQGNGTGSDGIPINTPASGKFEAFEMMDYGAGNNFGTYDDDDILSGHFPTFEDHSGVSGMFIEKQNFTTLNNINYNSYNTAQGYGKRDGTYDLRTWHQIHGHPAFSGIVKQPCACPCKGTNPSFDEEARNMPEVNFVHYDGTPYNDSDAVTYQGQKYAYPFVEITMRFNDYDTVLEVNKGFPWNISQSGANNQVPDKQGSTANTGMNITWAASRWSQGNSLSLTNAISWMTNNHYGDNDQVYGQSSAGVAYSYLNHPNRIPIGHDWYGTNSTWNSTVNHFWLPQFAPTQFTPSTTSAPNEHIVLHGYSIDYGPSSSIIPHNEGPPSWGVPQSSSAVGINNAYGGYSTHVLNNAVSVIPYNDTSSTLFPHRCNYYWKFILNPWYSSL